MITTRNLRKVVGSVIPQSKTKPVKFKLSCDHSAATKDQHLIVVTDAWKKEPRFERNKKIISVIHKMVPTQERNHIISVNVFTEEELKERKAFEKSLSRNAPSSKAPRKRTAAGLD